MKAIITSISDKKKSKHEGYCILITFKGDDGKSYHSWIATECNNYAQWQEVFKAGVDTQISGLEVKEGNLVNADSIPKIVPKVIDYSKLILRSKRVQALDEMREHGIEVGWAKKKTPEEITDEKQKQRQKELDIKGIPF